MVIKWWWFTADIFPPGQISTQHYCHHCLLLIWLSQQLWLSICTHCTTVAIYTTKQYTPHPPTHTLWWTLSGDACSETHPWCFLIKAVGFKLADSWRGLSFCSDTVSSHVAELAHAGWTKSLFAPHHSETEGELCWLSQYIYILVYAQKHSQTPDERDQWGITVTWEKMRKQIVCVWF